MQVFRALEVFVSGRSRNRRELIRRLLDGGRACAAADGLWFHGVDEVGSGRLPRETRAALARAGEPFVVSGGPFDLEAAGLAAAGFVALGPAQGLIAEFVDAVPPSALDDLARYAQRIADRLHEELAMFAPSGRFTRSALESFVDSALAGVRARGECWALVAVADGIDALDVPEAARIADLEADAVGILLEHRAEEALAIGRRISDRSARARVGVVPLDRLALDAGAPRAIAHALSTARRASADAPVVEYGPGVDAIDAVDAQDLFSVWGVLLAVKDPARLDRLLAETLDRLLPILDGARGAIWSRPETGEGAWSARLVVDRAGAGSDIGDRDVPLIGRAVARRGIEVLDGIDGPRAMAIALGDEAEVTSVLYVGKEHGALTLGRAERAFVVELCQRIGAVLADVRTMGRAMRHERQAGEHLRQQAIELRRLLRARAGLIGDDPSMKAVMKSLERCGAANVPVLITGETGTGKEAAARLIHRLSGRRGPLVVVDCGAMPGPLLESELFGHEKGAFTGADAKKIGRFQEAEGGTIFLDEIGELPLELQPKLLRVLQEATVRPVGGKEEIHLDFRLVAATNRDLGQMVHHKTFREDLLFRLRVMEIVLPALRDRGEDVMLLAFYFLRQYCMETGRDFLSISPEAQAALLSHRWPGNVRELQNTIRRAVLMAPGTELLPSDLGLEAIARREKKAASSPAPPAEAVRGEVTGTLEDTVADWFWDVWRSTGGGPPQDAVEAYLLRAALEATSGSIGRASSLLAMHADTFSGHLERLGRAAASRSVRDHALARVLDAEVRAASDGRGPPILDRALRVLLRELLVSCRGNKSEMARQLGWGRQTLLRHLARLET
jgi:DNA-binding NtrC family response regulator